MIKKLFFGIIIGLFAGVVYYWSLVFFEIYSFSVELILAALIIISFSVIAFFLGKGVPEKILIFIMEIACWVLVVIVAPIVHFMISMRGF